MLEQNKPHNQPKLKAGFSSADRRGNSYHRRSGNKKHWKRQKLKKKMWGAFLLFMFC